MQKDIFINNINKNWINNLIKSEKKGNIIKSYYTYLNAYLIKKLSNIEIGTIYVFIDKPLFINNKIVTEFKNIKFIVTSSFNYILKHFALEQIFTKESIVLTNNIWDYYLIGLGIKVYGLKYKNLIEQLELVTEKDIRKKILDLEIDQYLDYLALQEKNEDSLGQGKTIKLLKKYKTLENIFKNLDSEKNQRTKDSIVFQKNKFNYYLYLKNFFLTSADFN